MKDQIELQFEALHNEAILLFKNVRHQLERQIFEAQESFKYQIDLLRAENKRLIEELESLKKKEE